MVLLLLSPCVAVREKRWERCPICDAYEPSTRVWIMKTLTIRSSSSDCIGGEHVWLVSASQTNPHLPWGGMLGNYGLNWGLASEYLLRPWFLEDPEGEDRQRVRRALQIATREEIDEALSPELASELFTIQLQGDDPGWSEHITAWAARVLARDTDQFPYSAR